MATVSPPGRFVMLRGLVRWVRKLCKAADRYRPERHYLRGSGPKSMQAKLNRNSHEKRRGPQ
jgi:hypothetical protein